MKIKIDIGTRGMLKMLKYKPKETHNVKPTTIYMDKALMMLKFMQRLQNFKRYLRR